MIWRVLSLVAVLAASARAHASPTRVVADEVGTLSLAGGLPWTPPSTGLEVSAIGAWVGDRNVAGAAGGIRARGSWAPMRWLELGVEGGVEGWSIGADGYGASRAGLSTLVVSVGMGAVMGRAAEAVRLVAGIGPSALGAGAIDAPDRSGILGLRLDGVFVGSMAELRIHIELGVVFREWASFVGGGQLDVVLGDPRSALRLVAGVSEHAGGEALALGTHGGIVWAIHRAARLRVVVGLPMLGDDPFGRRAWLSASFVTVVPQ